MTGRNKTPRLAREIARQFGLAWAQNPTSVDNPNPSTYNWNAMNGKKVVELLQEISNKLDLIPPALERIPEETARRTAELLTLSLERIPEKTAQKLQSAVFGKWFEREAESEVFTYALRLGEMPQYPPKALEPRVKAWRKAKLMDGLLITDAKRIYVIQAKMNSRDWVKAVEQMGKALQRILADLKRAKLQYQVVPVFAFEHVDHPRKLVANFKNLKAYEGAAPPLLLLQQGVVVTHEGKRIRLY